LFAQGGAFAASEIDATMVFVSDEVKGGRLVVRSVGSEDAQQEGNNGHATYQSSLSHAYWHPVNRTPRFYTRMVNLQTRS
jgi:hypothetical protein